MWHSEGTVSVSQGSSAVTGVLTKFVEFSRVGDGFVGPDGALYEILNVASSTVLAIKPTYMGPSVSDAAYTIIPVQGYNKLLSDRVAAIVDGIDDDLQDMQTQLENKVDKEAGKGLSENSYTTTEKTKLSNIAAGATAWSETLTRNTTLAGLSIVNSVVAAGDAILTALGKLQGQFNSLGTAAKLNTGTASGNVMLAGQQGTPVDSYCYYYISSTIAASTLNFNSQLGVGVFGSLMPHANPSGPGGAGFGYLENMGRSGGNAAQQILHPYAVGSNPGDMYFRGYTGSSWTGWAKLLSTYNMVGSVSQSSGLPTGAVIERGSNSYGDFVKLADGTMILTSGTLTFSTPSYSGGSNSNVFSVSLPNTFIGTNFLFLATAVPSLSNDTYGVTCSYPSGPAQGSLVIRNGATAQSFTVRFIAIGRWY